MLRFELPRIEHLHGDNDSHPMVEVAAHDPSASDPERAWSKGRIFSCTACHDEIRVSFDEERKDVPR